MQTEQKITGHTWQQQKMFDTVDKAFTSMNNNGGGLLGTIMAANMMGAFGASGVSGQMMAPASQQTYTGGNPQPGSPAMNQQQYQQRRCQPGSPGNGGLLLKLQQALPVNKQILPILRRPIQPMPSAAAVIMHQMQQGASIAEHNFQTFKTYARTAIRQYLKALHSAQTAEDHNKPTMFVLVAEQTLRVQHSAQTAVTK